MADLRFIIEEIKGEWSKKANNAIQSVSKRNINDIKKVRTNIINEWFRGFNGTPFSQNKIQEVHPSFSGSGLNYYLEFETWTETSGIDPGEFESAVRWTSDYGGDPVEMVSSLVFDQGIIGLPLNSTIPNYSGRGWLNGVNLHFHQYDPLDFAIKSSEKWVEISNKIEKEIIQKINQ